MHNSKNQDVELSNVQTTNNEVTDAPKKKLPPADDKIKTWIVDTNDMKQMDEIEYTLFEMIESIEHNIEEKELPTDEKENITEVPKLSRE